MYRKLALALRASLLFYLYSSFSTAATVMTLREKGVSQVYEMSW